APGANLRAIRLHFPGATATRIDRSGNLVIKTSSGEIRQRLPKVFQLVDGTRRSLKARYLIDRRHEVRLTLEENIGRNGSRWPLVIDPVLELASYFGGSGYDTANGVAVDSHGNAYVVGTTYSLDLPVTAGAVQGSFGGGGSYAFIAKFDP